MNLARFLIISSAAGLFFAGPQSSFQARTGSHGPKANLRYAKPTIRWEIWSDQGAVTAHDLRLNGVPQASQYRPDHRAVVFDPAKPLEPGSYQVEAKVTFAGGFTFDKNWSFTVSPSAKSELDAANARQTEGFRAANRLRTELGLPEYRLDSRLCAAAQAHADYLDQNNATGHGEAASLPGFLAVSPSDRVDAFGWSGSTYEGVSSSSESAAEAIRGLFDAPYHRIPFLQPGKVAFGLAFSGEKGVTETESSPAEGVVVSPGDGTTVSRSWSGNERPNPLRLHGSVTGPTGYPLVVASFGGDPSRFSVQVLRLLTAEGVEVPGYLNTPATDKELRAAAIFIPRSPLPAGRYRVSSEGTDGKGMSFSKSWTFNVR